MTNIICLMKSKTSYHRILMQFQDRKIEWEDFLEELENLQENIVFRNYDIAIVDEKLWWKNEAIELFELKNIKVIFFQGDFEDIAKRINELLPDEEAEETIKEVIEEQKEEVGQIRYIETEKIINKEIKVPVEVYKSIYTGIPNKLITVINLSKRAGSTFITLNLAKAITDFNILASVIEPPIDKPYIFDTVGLEEKLEIDEDITSLKFTSIPHLIDSNLSIERDKETIIDGIAWLVPDSRRALIKEWDYYKMMKLIYTSKKAPFIFIDCGSNFENLSIKPILNESDLVLLVVDPLPTEVMQNIEIFDTFVQMKKNGLPLEIIVNRFNPGIDKRKLINFLKVEPLVYVPHIEPKHVYKAIYDCKIPYENNEVKEELEKSFYPILKKLIPKELVKSSENIEKKNKFRISNLFKKGD